jgi:succinoglycan biosynthesis transport protein ExoP
VREELGLDFFGLLPLVDETFWPKKRDKTPAPGSLSNTPSGMRYVLDHPLSGFTEVLRTAKVASDLMLGAKEPKIIGIISALPGEGKSTVSKNFASLLAHLGSPTLLIDGDLRNPGLTRALAPMAEMGIVEVALSQKSLAEVLLAEPGSGLRFLPASLKRQVSHTSDMLASPEMGRLLQDAAGIFKHIVIDLPPLGPVVDVRAFAPRADAFIFVTEWGRTARKVVRNALAEDDQVYRKTMGVVLNKVNENEIRLYENYSSSDFYHAQYKDYYRKNAS